MATESRTIFIIDDEPNICDSLRYLFESMHFKVETYSNAQGFLDKYDANKQGCIILDVRLPGMSGLKISISTVEAHRSNMVRKMQAKNFAQLIKMYLKYQFEAVQISE
jgi:FixJ family two-component response regulator